MLPVGGSLEEMRDALRETIREAVESQWRYALASVERGIARALESEEVGIERLLEAASIAYEGIEVEFGDSGRDLDPSNAARAVSEQTGLPIEAEHLQGLQGRQLEHAVMDQVRVLARAQIRARMLAQVQARSGVQWPVDRSLLVATDGQAVLRSIMDLLRGVAGQQAERLTKEVEGDIASKVRRPGDCTEAGALRFLNEVRFGSRTEFDSSHQRVSQRTERFRFTYLVADRAATWGREGLEDEVLTHLGDAIVAWEGDWGRRELQRIGAYEWSSLDQETRAGIRDALGEEPFADPEAKRVSDLTAEQAQTVRAYLGRRVLFNVQRQLMLDITSRYWVEHLTAMEVLRQGIGLQSYAQRDPLAEYKVRAYDMFQELLLAIQSDIVAAMFVYRPRDLSQVRVGVGKGASRAQPSARRSSGKRPRRRRKKR
jgi:preprotein translocase subunit SecA